MNLTDLTSTSLIDNFALFDDWEQRYTYVLDLAKNLPDFPAEKKTEEFIVKGCMSQVWLVDASHEKDKIHFLADSDAHIVRGLIAILMILYNGADTHTVRTFDIEAYFARLGLGDHLSPNRRNGFFAMVNRIKALAQA